MTNEKLNPFMQFVESYKGFGKPDSYYKLSKQSGGSKFLYAVLISLLACVITFIPAGLFICMDKGLASTIETMPDFSLENSQFVCEAKVDEAYGDAYLFMNTDYDVIYCKDKETNPPKGIDVSEKVQEILRDGNIHTMLMVSRSNILNIQVQGGQYSYQNIYLSDIFGVLKIPTISKTLIQDGYKGFIMRCVTFLTFIIWPFKLIGIFWYALLWSLIGLIVNSVCKKNVSFETIYWMSFYLQCAFMMIHVVLGLGGRAVGIVLNIGFLIAYIIIMKNNVCFEEQTQPLTQSSSFEDDYYNLEEQMDE